MKLTDLFASILPEDGEGRLDGSGGPGGSQGDTGEGEDAQQGVYASLTAAMADEHIGEPSYEPDDGYKAGLWNEWHPRLPGTIHRALGVEFPSGHPANDTRLPMHERAHAALDEVTQRGLGMHWTSDPGYHSKHLAPRLMPGETPVVVHAQTPPREHVEDNDWVHEDRAIRDWDMDPEKEVPVKRNAPVHITGITWGRNHHDFAEPIAKRAAAVPASDVTRAFYQAENSVLPRNEGHRRYGSMKEAQAHADEIVAKEGLPPVAVRAARGKAAANTSRYDSPNPFAKTERGRLPQISLAPTHMNESVLIHELSHHKHVSGFLGGQPLTPERRAEFFAQDPGGHGTGFQDHFHQMLSDHHTGGPELADRVRAASVEHGARTASLADDEGLEIVCRMPGDDHHRTAAALPRPELPQEQAEALDHPDFGEYRRRSLEVARRAAPGTHVWRSEHRPEADPVAGARNTGVGMHWTTNPDAIVGGTPPEGHHAVVWHGELDHEAQPIPRDHAMWTGRHRSMDSEAEVRLQPGSKVKLHGAYVWEGHGDPQGHPAVRNPEHTPEGWAYHPVGEHAEVSGPRGHIDYSDVMGGQEGGSGTPAHSMPRSVAEHEIGAGNFYQDHHDHDPYDDIDWDGPDWESHSNAIATNDVLHAGDTQAHEHSDQDLHDWLTHHPDRAGIEARHGVRAVASARNAHGQELRSPFLAQHGRTVTVDTEGYGNAEMVPTHEIAQYATQPTDREHAKKVAGHVLETGKITPLILEYHPASGQAYLGEGNHRLRMGIAMNTSEMPVRVLRRAYGLSGEGADVPQDHPAHTAGEHVPADIRPSDLGIGVNRRTAAGHVPVGRTGDGWVTCDQGHEHWGTQGAAGMMIRHTDERGRTRYLMQKRAPWVQHGGTWSIPGGALNGGESPEAGAHREASEELGHLPKLRHSHTSTDDHGGWAYHTVVSDSPHQFHPDEDADGEGSEHKWMTEGEINGLHKNHQLHPGFAASWAKDHADEHAPKKPALVHRGMTVVLSPEKHRFVHDQSQPQAARAHMLLSELGKKSSDITTETERSGLQGGTGGLGEFWSPSHTKAREFASQSGHGTYHQHEREHNCGDEWSGDDGCHTTHVVVSSAEPAKQHHWTDAMHPGEEYHREHSWRLPVKPGTKMPVHEMSWTEGDDHMGVFDRMDHREKVGELSNGQRILPMKDHYNFSSPVKKRASQHGLREPSPPGGLHGVDFHGHGVRYDEQDGWRHLDGSIGEDCHVGHGHAQVGDYPVYVHDHVWLPQGRYWGPNSAQVDQRLFDGWTLRPEVRQDILSRIDTVWHAQYPDWREWTKVYFAGSQAAQWTDVHGEGNGDFDILLGIDWPVFRHAHPEVEGTREQIAEALTTELWHRANISDYMFTLADGEEVGPFDRTFFVNSRAWDIRELHPYAAYDVTADTWAVKPIKVPADWSASRLPESYWVYAESLVNEIDAIGALPPEERHRMAANLWEELHTHRSDAFADGGKGLFDLSNIVEKYLDQRPDQPWARLVEWKSQSPSGAEPWVPTTARRNMFTTAEVREEVRDPQSGADYEGVMIALVPPQEVCEALAVEKGEPVASMHITLAYLGGKDEYTPTELAALPGLVRDWAAVHKPLTSKVGGVGTFVHPSQHVLWAAVDIPHGTTFRDDLVGYLEKHGYKIRHDHGWTPHITLAYGNTHFRFMPKVEPHEWSDQRIWCCIGGRWESYDLRS